MCLLIVYCMYCLTSSFHNLSLFSLTEIILLFLVAFVFLLAILLQRNTGKNTDKVNKPDTMNYDCDELDLLKYEILSQK